MINFEEIKYKNFLSVGNQPVVIQLNRSPTTLIFGTNGQGKSTFLDALNYALFGEAFRKVNLALLINSTNNTEMLVELKFSIGKNRYKIERGRKPTVFNVYVNDVLLNKDAKDSDYQKHLEQSILKMNEKSFRQIVVLGSADFVPFMKLQAKDKREVIEDLLDISIFTSMNKVVKGKNDQLKDDIREVDYAAELLNNQQKMLTQFIAKNEEKLTQDIAVKKTKIKEIVAQVQEKQTELGKITDDLVSERAKISDEDAVNKKHREYTTALVGLEQSHARTSKADQFFHDNENCPTCKQGITEEHKKEVFAKNAKQLTDLETAIHTAKKMIGEIEERQAFILDCKKDIRRYEDQANELKAAINVQMQVLETLEKELKTTTAPNLEEDKAKLQAVEVSIGENKKTRRELLGTKEYYDDIMLLLKDTGIKTKIIKHYLPLMNEEINKFLTQLGLNISFHLDETFTETIKSRFRKEFTYYSFSEGEKQRINWAIMFAWRFIAAKKNSVNTNLLLMDETFDSSLDVEGTTELLNLINELTKEGKTNVFVISHKSDDILYDKFRSAIQFKKVNGFTRMVA